MTGPTLAQTLTAQSAITGDTSTLSVSLTSVSVGDLVVVKAQTWDTGTPAGTPSGGSQTYTRQCTIAPGGFASYGTIFTSVMAAGVASSFTLTLSAPTASCGHSMVVERWTSATLAATPATNTASYSTASLPSSTITTVAANSVVSWLCGDEQSINPATDAYISPAPATPELLVDGHASNDAVFRYTTQAAATAGSQTYGMTAPTGQKWCLAAIEIQYNPTAAALPLAPVVIRQAVNRAATW